jgi:hypothetical protein
MDYRILFKRLQGLFAIPVYLFKPESTRHPRSSGPTSPALMAMLPRRTLFNFDVRCLLSTVPLWRLNPL